MASPRHEPPPCPFCGSTRTEVMSLFGSHASLTTCWCEACRSPFEFLRWRAEPEGGGPPGHGEQPDGGDPPGQGSPHR
ncbi:MAG: hypothetical protein OXF01_00825 [Gemmatimonadetes bacterium]|nr:hypothetical protein [Gemmatimonadota bacterium]